MNNLPKDSIYRLLAENSTDLLWAKDLEGRYIFVNSVVCEKLLIADGIEEPLGKTDLFFAHRQRALYPDNPNWHTFGELCMDSDQVVIKERKAQRFDEFGNVQGKFLYLDVYKSPLFDDQGTLIGTMGSGRIVTRQRKQQQQLEQSEALFRSFAETSQDVFFRLDRTGRITYLSPASSVLLGVNHEEWDGRHYLSGIAHEDHALAGKAFSELLAGKDKESLILHTFGKDGMPVWMEIHATPYYKKEGIAGVQGIVRDISERKQYEEKLHLFNQRLIKMVEIRTRELFINTQLLQNALDTVAAGIGIVSQGIFSYVNDTMEKLTGYKAEELVGKQWEMLFTSSDRANSVVEMNNNSDQDDSNQPVERLWRRKDNTYCNVLLSVQSVVKENQAQGDLLVTAFDITAAKQAEREALQAYNELDQIYNVAIPLCLLSTACRVVRVNQAFCHFLGLSEENILGKTGEELWLCNHCHTAKCYLKMFAAGAANIVEDVERTINGQEKICTVHAVPFKDTAGKLKGIVLTFLDISAQRKIQRDLEHTQKQLIQAEKFSAIGALTASITHEFNSPVCGIKNVLQRVLRKADMGEMESSLMQLALDECKRIEQMVRDLQNFSVPPTTEKVAFDLHTMLDSVALFLKKYLKQNKVSLNFAYTGTLQVVGAKDQLKQVCLSLIIRSINSIPETGGSIILTTTRHADHIELVIADDGQGLNAEEVMGLWDPLDSSCSAKRGGGAGLAMSQSIVRNHGGDVNVQATPGKGTVVKVLLPVEPLSNTVRY
ncbi:PAS domain-containing sensor histidine kinase [Desulfogranum marinum]|uniref:PAS domain-containing sensor histidine kinase n=1 Tax=Desulfogranum marinum TaxID=453220 RepID=UPI0019669DC1|nr:PAS domain-containing sensor histidine kinase [Desulfogranum marinum]MBM9511062.1 PAS domain S-box protein [Desulfogranum marinum]